MMSRGGFNSEVHLVSLSHCWGFLFFAADFTRLAVVLSGHRHLYFDALLGARQ